MVCRNFIPLNIPEPSPGRHLAFYIHLVFTLSVAAFGGGWVFVGDFVVVADASKTDRWFPPRSLPLRLFSVCVVFCFTAFTPNFWFVLPPFGWIFFTLPSPAAFVPFSTLCLPVLPPTTPPYDLIWGSLLHRQTDRRWHSAFGQTVFHMPTCATFGFLPIPNFPSHPTQDRHYYYFGLVPTRHLQTDRTVLF